MAGKLLSSLEGHRAELLPVPVGPHLTQDVMNHWSVTFRRVNLNLEAFRGAYFSFVLLAFSV